MEREDQVFHDLFGRVQRLQATPHQMVPEFASPDIGFAARQLMQDVAAGRFGL